MESNCEASVDLVGRLIRVAVVSQRFVADAGGDTMQHILVLWKPGLKLFGVRSREAVKFVVRMFCRINAHRKRREKRTNDNDDDAHLAMGKTKLWRKAGFWD